MQLFFTMDELKLLVDIIEHCDRELQAEVSTCAEQAASLARRREGFQRLLDRIVVRDFGFGYDELEDMVEMLAAYRARFRSAGPKPQPGVEAAADERGRILERMLDKVTEACAMA